MDDTVALRYPFHDRELQFGDANRSDRGPRQEPSFDRTVVYPARGLNPKEQRTVKVFLIAYDLIKPEKDYADLINAIRGISGYWCHVQKSLWMVKAGSSATAASIESIVAGATDSNDKVLVVDVTADAMAWVNLSQEISDWIKANFAG